MNRGFEAILICTVADSLKDPVHGSEHAFLLKTEICLRTVAVN